MCNFLVLKKRQGRNFGVRRSTTFTTSRATRGVILDNFRHEICRQIVNNLLTKLSAKKRQWRNFGGVSRTTMLDRG